MHVFELTRALIDIPSVTPEEEQVGQYLYDHLSRICAAHNGLVEKIEVEPKRSNVFAAFGDPVVTLSTHMDTVPPFVPSREDDEFIWGRGACDTKGIIASMITAAERLLEAGRARFRPAVRRRRGAQQRGRVSCGAASARIEVHHQRRAHREPARARIERRAALRSWWRAARWRTPRIRELGDSAIEKLLDVLDAIRKVELPVDDVLGAKHPEHRHHSRRPRAQRDSR